MPPPPKLTTAQKTALLNQLHALGVAATNPTPNTGPARLKEALAILEVLLRDLAL